MTGCELLAAGQSTVWMQGFAQNNTITGNIIRDSGFCAVYLSGYCRASSTEDRRRRLATAGGATARLPLSPSRQRAQLREAYHSRECTYDSFSSPEETYVSKRNTISHNFMSDGNLAIGGFAGVYLYESGENQIVHNVIKRYARDSIGLFGSEPAIGAVQYGIRMNYDNSFRFTQTKENYIAWNDIVCQIRTRMIRARLRCTALAVATSSSTMHCTTFTTAERGCTLSCSRMTGVRTLLGRATSWGPL